MMALFVGRRGTGTGQVFALALGVAALGLPRDASAADINVVLDQARLVKLPDRVATIVIGNPLIADISLQGGGGTMVVTGKSYGVTNLVALDRAGAVLMNSSVEVRAPSAGVVVVYKGIERESYSCTPNCERRITLGDSPAFFDATMSQAAARSTMAQGTAQAAK
jgi:Flp pilus assembly secretin CpaC